MFADRPRAFSLVVAIASITAVGLGISLAIPLLSLTLEARGVTPGWIGANAAAWGLASMVMTPFVQALAARFRLRRVLGEVVCIKAHRKHLDGHPHTARLFRGRPARSRARQARSRAFAGGLRPRQ